MNRWGAVTIRGSVWKESSSLLVNSYGYIYDRDFQTRVSRVSVTIGTCLGRHFYIIIRHFFFNTYLYQWCVRERMKTLLTFVTTLMIPDGSWGLTFPEFSCSKVSDIGRAIATARHTTTKIRTYCSWKTSRAKKLEGKNTDHDGAVIIHEQKRKAIWWEGNARPTNNRKCWQNDGDQQSDN